jgi:hypothetical protein
VPLSARAAAYSGQRGEEGCGGGESAGAGVGGEGGGGGELLCGDVFESRAKSVLEKVN